MSTHERHHLVNDGREIKPPKELPQKMQFCVTSRSNKSLRVSHGTVFVFMIAERTSGVWHGHLVNAEGANNLLGARIGLAEVQQGRSI